jgi:hypothetical protein
MPESASRIVAVTAGVNPVSGVDSYVIEFDDGETQTHERPWSEARELADRAGLDHREDGTHWTRWARRGLTLLAVGLAAVITACSMAPSGPEPTEPLPSLIPPASCVTRPPGRSATRRRSARCQQTDPTRRSLAGRTVSGQQRRPAPIGRGLLRVRCRQIGTNEG